MIRRALLVFSLVLLALPAAAQERWVQFASGTGFFINRMGDVVTNAHVVKNCQAIVVRLPGGDKGATLAASDTARDLAILKTYTSPPGIAPLRWNIQDLKVGDPLFIYGFPGEAGASGKPDFVRTTLSNMHGPTGQPEWLQLESAAQQGNSGGPVLDASGNVIAVIFGRAEIYQTSGNTPPTLIGKSGVAITLSVLRDFLSQNLAGYYESSSGLVTNADEVIENNARQFTYPVLCIQGTITK